MTTTTPHERSPYAPKVEDKSQEETKYARAMRPRRCVNIGQKYPEAQGKGKRRPSSQRHPWHRSVGKRICGRFRSINAYAERKGQNSSELETLGVFQNSSSGYCSKWRCANERGSSCVCRRTGFVHDSESLRRYTSSALARKKTVRRTRILLRVDQWSLSTLCEKGQKDSLLYRKSFADRFPGVVNRFLQLDYKFVCNHVIAGRRRFHISSCSHPKSEYEW